MEEARRPLLAFAHVVARYDIDAPGIGQFDVQDAFRELIASAHQLTGYTPPPEEELEDFTCKGCGRDEAECSEDPCANVIADREATHCATCAAANDTRAFPCDECGHSDEHGDA